VAPEPALVLQSDPVADPILDLTSIIPRALRYLLAHFHCAAPGYQRMECKDILVYIVDYSLQEPHLIL